jgi:hypothetical protein
MATPWVLTKGMQNLWDQFYAAFPNADRASSGKVGDLAHQLESASGHNPDLTDNAEWKDGDVKNEVRAIDLDDDLRTPGVTMQKVVDHLRALPGVSSVLRYIIYDRTIYEASNGWRGRPYTGPSPHTEHAHFSGQRTQASDENTTFDYRFEELTDMPITDAEIAKIAAASRDALLAAEVEDYADPATPNRKLPLRTWFGYFEGREITTRSVIIAAINAAAGDNVNEAEVIAGVLAGLTPEKIAAAIPSGLAGAVADELRARLEN